MVLLFNHIYYLYLDNLINQWSFKSDLKDSIRSCDFNISSGYAEFSKDRFGNYWRSLYLFNQYAHAPTSTYFYNEFSIIIWFKKYYVSNYYDSIALFDFSFDNSHNIGLKILLNNILFWTKNNANGSIINLDSNCKTNYDQWYHIALTYSNKSKLIKLYVNGVRVNSLYVNLRLGETNLNYIGRSDTLNITGSEFLIDEIKIYNRVLNFNEIKIDSNDRPITTTTPNRATTTIDKCKNYYCYNGGKCWTDYYGHSRCNCISNYHGNKCEYSNFF